MSYNQIYYRPTINDIQIDKYITTIQQIRGFNPNMCEIYFGGHFEIFVIEASHEI